MQGSGVWRREIGCLVKSAKYDNVDISNDTINNVSDGIAFWALSDPEPYSVYPHPSAPWQYLGLCNLSNNLIQANPLGTAAITTQMVTLGISVQNALPNAAHAFDTANRIHVDDNQMNDVYEGVYVNNFWKQVPTSNSNNITLRPYTGHRLQYGINHTLCRGSQIYSNLISGDVATAAKNDSMRAVYASSNTGIGVACNTETMIGCGYEFFLKNPGTAWHDNTMNNNIKGMVLNGAIIGTQHFNGLAINNQWLGSWGATDTQTYVYHGANAIYDTMYVAPGTITTPVFNGGWIYYWDYSTTFGSIQLETSHGGVTTPFCMSLPVVGVNQSPEIALFQQITQQQILYPNNVIPNNWIGQFATWQNIVADTTILDSSTVLSVFASLAENSRYAYLTNLDAAVATGDFHDAWTMLGYNIDSMANTSVDSVSQVRMADNLASDFIVQNYQQFYELYMKYAEHRLHGADSLAIFGLASLCPEINGTVVYQARSLYSAVYNDLSTFNDDSCMDIDSSYSAERHANSNTVLTNNGDQNYILYPNPNDGNLSLQQLITDTKPVSVEISDIVGQSIYKEKLLFNGNSINLQLGTLIPGMYLLELTDNENRSFKFKFVVTKS